MAITRPVLEAKAARMFGRPVQWEALTSAERAYVLASFRTNEPQPTGRVFVIDGVAILEVL